VRPKAFQEETMFNARFSRRRLTWLAFVFALITLLIQSDLQTQAQRRDLFAVTVKGNSVVINASHKYEIDVLFRSAKVWRDSDGKLVSIIKCRTCPGKEGVSCVLKKTGPRTLICASDKCKECGIIVETP
jgi:hypothetical protein